MVQVAIPLFENRISPYFDYAPSLLIVRIHNGVVVSHHEAGLKGLDVRQRIEYVKNNNVEVVICGGIPYHIQMQMERAGIQVIPWVSGEADKALALYLKGKLEPGTMLCGRRRRRWCFCAGRKKSQS